MKYAKWILAMMLLLIPAIAAAQMKTTEWISAQVPFTFVVANHVIPLGNCTIRRTDTSGGALEIRSRSARVDVFATASLTEGRVLSGKYTLVFHKYGMRYFLAGVKLENSPVVYWFTPSRYEVEALAEGRPATEKTLLASAR